MTRLEAPRLAFVSSSGEYLDALVAIEDRDTDLVVWQTRPDPERPFTEEFQTLLRRMSRKCLSSASVASRVLQPELDGLLDISIAGPRLASRVGDETAIRLNRFVVEVGGESGTHIDPATECDERGVTMNTVACFAGTSVASYAAVRGIDEQTIGKFTDGAIKAGNAILRDFGDVATEVILPPGAIATSVTNVQEGPDGELYDPIAHNYQLLASSGDDRVRTINHFAFDRDVALAQQHLN